MFSPNPRSAMHAYRDVGVASIAETAEPHQLVLMLFNGARAAVAAAIGHMQRNEITKKCETIAKAIAIIDGGLKASLDLRVGGELARNLGELYDYMSRRLLHANLKNDVAALEDVAKLLQQLGSAWEALPAAMARSGAAQAKPAGDPSASAAPSAAAPVATAAPNNRIAAAYGRF